MAINATVTCPKNIQWDSTDLDLDAAISKYKHMKAEAHAFRLQTTMSKVRSRKI